MEFAIALPILRVGLRVVSVVLSVVSLAPLTRRVLPAPRVLRLVLLALLIALLVPLALLALLPTYGKVHERVRVMAIEAQ